MSYAPRVAVLSYPMLFQNQGGLQVQVLETVAALQRLGVDAQIIDPSREKLEDFELVHIFSAINGNHRIAEQAKAIGRPVVTSPLIRPHWTRTLGRKARLLESLVGRLTHWEVKTEYRHIRSCLENSDRLVALGSIEGNCIVEAFGISPARIDIIPNGIPERFFTANSRLFQSSTGIAPGFVLCVASINPHKNQAGLVDAVKDLGIQVVLIGPCLETNRPYLERMTAQSNVKYLGSLAYDDPLLASAYASAGLFCLPSQSEVMPLSVMESLAAGTPVVMTRHHCMDLSNFKNVIKEVSPLDRAAIRASVEHFTKNPPEKTVCQASVQHLTWSAVGTSLLTCYNKLVQHK
jgi:glycosyltransferase involved in cell wall biosynthesis